MHAPRMSALQGRWLPRPTPQRLWTRSPLEPGSHAVLHRLTSNERRHFSVYARTEWK
jgi:hypothetical protein